MRLFLFYACFGLCTTYAQPDVVSIKELFFSSRDRTQNVDTPAVWYPGEGSAWLISTCKGTHNLRIEDAENAAQLRSFGGLGTGSGQFARPNGVFVIDDLLLVVERDNRRVQVLSLPSLQTLTTFGTQELHRPYGLWVLPHGDRQYSVFVTDDFDIGVVPLSERVKVYDLEVEGTQPDTAGADFIRSFGANEGPGQLRVVESIWGDPFHERLLVADEFMDDGDAAVCVYTLDGEFTGQRIGEGIFLGQPEGIALFEADQRSGFWILTDQGKSANYFHVFDRESLSHIVSFTGETTLNTDGIWLAPRPIGRYPKGLFFAVHNDGNVAAFDFAEIRSLVEQHR